MIRRTISVALLLLAIASAVAKAQGQSSAAATLSRCVQTTGRLDVVFMIDEHQSIRFTDPLGLRVDGVDAALAGFERLAQMPLNGRTLRIKVLLEGFGGIVIPDPNAPGALSDWMRLDAGTLPGVLAAANQYRSRHAIEDTDFALALSAARTLLAREAVAETEAGGPPPCKALIWFTNGRYLITDRDRAFNEFTYMGLAGARGTPANPLLPLSEPYAPGLRLGTPGSGTVTQAAGERYLCRPGGVMDGLQSDGVVKFTFGLTELMSPSQEAFLEAITSGRGSDAQCGTTLSDQAGQYLPIAQDRCLLFVFAGLLDGTGCPAPTTPVCPKTDCQRGLNAFRTIAGISSFLIRADTGGTGIEIDLSGPDGRHVSFIPGSTTSLRDSGASISQQWYSNRDVELTGALPFPSSSWVGPWTYGFVDPTGSDTSAVPISQVELSADLTPELSERHVYRGATTPHSLYFTDSAGRNVASGPLLAGARPTATVTDPQTRDMVAAPVGPRQADGTFAIPLTVPAGMTSPYVLLSVDVPFAIGTGAEILPLRRTFELAVELPAGEGFPTVSPSSLELASISGNGSATATLTVRGSALGRGCIWIGPPRYAAPGGTQSVGASTSPAASSAARCLPLAKGQSVRVHVTFSVRGATAGTMSVSVPVHLHSDLVDRTELTEIGGSIELYPPANVGTRVAIIVALVLLGVLIPIALLLALNWLSGRFTAPQQIRSAAAEVRLGTDGRLCALDGGPVRIPPDEVLPLSSEGTDRRVRSVVIETTSKSTESPEVPILLRTSLARSVSDVFRGPCGLASAGGRPLVVGADRELRCWSYGTLREVPLSLPGVWVFLPAAPQIAAGDEPAENSGGAIEGRLVVLIRNGDDDLEAGQKLADRAASHLAQMDRTGLVFRPSDEDGSPRRSWRVPIHPLRHDDDAHRGEPWDVAEVQRKGWSAGPDPDDGDRSDPDPGAGPDPEDHGPGLRF